MDKIDKALAKIPAKQRRQIMLATAKIIANEFEGLDIKRLKGPEALFRVRVGNYRIVYKKISPQRNIVTLIAKRNEKTYKDV